MKAYQNSRFKALKQSVILVLAFCLTSGILITCDKEDPKINIILRDKPLEVIQSYVQGKWILNKITGGICTTCGAPIKNNPYMIISDNQIVLGNDVGIVVDTVIVWQKISYPSGNDSTYLLSYQAEKYYAFPINYIVDRIENNDLILIDYSSDPFYYFYSKIN